MQRLNGRVLAANPATTAEAEAAYLRAIAMTQAQKAPVLEFRAATDLAVLRKDPAPARALLEKLSDLATEPDVVEFAAILDGISEPRVS